MPCPPPLSPCAVLRHRARTPSMCSFHRQRFIAAKVLLGGQTEKRVASEYGAWAVPTVDIKAQRAHRVARGYQALDRQRTHLHKSDQHQLCVENKC